MCALPSVAAAQLRYELDGQTLRISEPTRVREVPLGCAGVELVLHAGAAYVRCAEGDVARVQLDAEGGDQVERLDVHGVGRLLRVDGELWIRRGAEVEQLAGAPPERPTNEPAGASPATTTPPAVAPPAAASPPAPPPNAPPPNAPGPAAAYEAPMRTEGDIPPAPSGTSAGPGPIVGEVERAGIGEVMVRLDLGAQVAEGDGVAFLATRQTQSALSFEAGGGTTEEVVASHGIVTAVQGAQARVRLQVGALASEGMRVRRLGAPPGLEVFPEIPAGQFAVAFHLRPFIPLATLGVGVIADVSLRYTFDFGLVIGVDAMPLGLATGSNGDAVAGLGGGFIGFSSPYFGIGLHIGASSFREFSRDQEAFMVAPMVMLGSRDGFMLRLRSSAVVIADRFDFGDFEGSMHIPLVHGVQLVANGRGGRAGTNFGDLGVRVLVQGNGRSEAIFFTATVGMGMLVGAGRGFSNAGPSIGAGLEWRP